MVTCNRCGLCCKGCKYLIFIGNNKTFCRIYKNRLNVEIRKGIFCIERKNQRDKNGYIEKFEGCPYNDC